MNIETKNIVAFCHEVVKCSPTHEDLVSDLPFSLQQLLTKNKQRITVLFMVGSRKSLYINLLIRYFQKSKKNADEPVPSFFFLN